MIMNSLFSALVNRIINFHNSGLIAASVTVVGRREDSNDLSVMLPLVALHDKLVGACDEMKTVDMSKLFRNILPESVTGSPR